jgi:hypothetical protein
MTQTLIFWPVCALALLTFTALALIPVRRFGAGAAGLVTAEDFKYGESPRVPPEVSIPNRNYMNLLELPILFYVVCMMFYLTRHVTLTVLAAAWAYVALRGLHSLVHLTYNNVRHRLRFFALSNFVLMALWTLFAVSLARQ